MADEKQKMYEGLVRKLLVLVLFLIFSAGCTTMYRDMTKWEGRTVNELYGGMGSPDKIEDIAPGHRVFIYEDGECRQTFTAVNYGNREEITDTSYSGCPFLTIKSH
jgi:hypothetical protein